MKKKITLNLAFYLVAMIAYSQSTYITKVYDFVPAPGQFVNEMPEYEEGDTKEDIVKKVEEAIAGNEKGLISLGGYGGYIVFGFDHMIVNVPDECDFKVWGNAFYSNSETDEEESRPGGSCEPGIIMVSYDANGNGYPDDEWYEIAGSEYYKSETIKNYNITYYKPDENKIPTPHDNNKALLDTSYIKWESNQGDYGYISRNIYHRQPYYPLWIEEENLIFEGTKLADNYIDLSGKGSNYILYSYDWGYADNHPNESEKSNINIEWAVDTSGTPVQLPGIHFVKVYTGLNQYCGWLGETSTEIMGAEDLHVEAQPPSGLKDISDKNIILLTSLANERLIITSFIKCPAYIYDTQGKMIMAFDIRTGTNYINVNYLQNGLYVLVCNGKQERFIKR